MTKIAIVAPGTYPTSKKFFLGEVQTFSGTAIRLGKNNLQKYAVHIANRFSKQAFIISSSVGAIRSKTGNENHKYWALYAVIEISIL